MAENQAGGPQLGQRVIYTPTPGTTYYADISAISLTTGTVRLNSFPPGGAMADVQNVTYDGTRTVAASWSYPDSVSGL